MITHTDKFVFYYGVPVAAVSFGTSKIIQACLLTKGVVYMKWTCDRGLEDDSFFDLSLRANRKTAFNERWSHAYSQ